MITDSPQVTIQLQEIDETVNILSDGVAVLNEDRQRLSTESIHQQQTLDSLTKDYSTLKISIQEQNAFLDGTKVNQEILQQDLASMGQKINDMKTSSYDGIFYWKIINVHETIGQQFMFCLAFL
jgi:chromosome segregation ATPase